MTDTIWEPSAEQVLKRRAELLAKLPVAAETGDEVEVLVCKLGGERYAVETVSPLRVQPMRERMLLMHRSAVSADDPTLRSMNPMSVKYPALSQRD